MVYWFVDHCYEHFYHKISGNSLHMWMGHVDSFRTKIWEEVVCKKDEFGNVIEGEYYVDVPFELWRIWSYIDCTNMHTCRPGSGPVGPNGERRENAKDIQKAFFRYVHRATHLDIYIYIATILSYSVHSIPTTQTVPI